MRRPITVTEQEISIPVDDVELAGRLAVPAEPHGLVIVPLRSSEGRDCPGNLDLADQLHRKGVASLLLDLLTDDEQWVDDLHPRRTLKDARLADRLAAAVETLLAGLPTPRLPVAVLAAGAATPIVVGAALNVPTIVSLVESAANSVEDSSLQAA